MTNSVDSPGVDITTNIPGQWKETVQAIIDLGGQAVGLKNIAQQRGCTKQAVSKHFPEIVDEEIITKEGKQQPFTYKLTGKGYRAVDSTPYGPGSVDRSGGSESGKCNRRLHGLTVVVKVAGGELVPEKWMGRLREEERVNFTKRHGENNYAVWSNRFFIRLHKDSATIQLREGVDYSADSDIEAFLEFHEDLQELLQWVERATGVSMKRDLVDLRRCELAFEEHHLALLVDKIPDLKLSDFALEDEDIGKEVIALDDSFGPELETKSAEQAEAIGHAVEHEMRQYAERPDAVRKRHRFENEMDLQGVSPQEAVQSIRQVSGVQEQLGEAVTRVEGLEDEVSEVREAVQSNSQLFEELQRNRREERNTRDALVELVRSNQNVVQQNNERMEKQEEIIEQQKELIEGQQEQISELSEKVESLEEKVEDLQEGKDSLSGDEGSLSGPRSLDDGGSGVSGVVEFENLEIGAGGKSSVGEDASNDADKQECSDIGEGMVFRDLRDGGKLLSVWEVNLREGSDGYYDEVKVRVCGTRKVWATMPRAELSRLLGTGRFKISDVPDPPR